MKLTNEKLVEIAVKIVKSMGLSESEMDDYLEGLIIREFQPFVEEDAPQSSAQRLP